MPNFNLEEMSLTELKDLQKATAAAIHSSEERRIAEARIKLEAVAREFGVKLEDIVGSASKGKGKAKSRSAIAPKFRHPEDPTLTWSGRGRRPAWFVLALESGITEAAMTV